MNMQHLNCGLVELKLAPSSESGTMEFSGYGAVFNNVDAYDDVIQPGAFSQYLDGVKSGQNQWPAMLLQHGGWGVSADDMTPIGVWTELSEDDHGLKVSGKLADTPRGREIYSLMKMDPRPAITGLSIGYIPQEFDRGDGKNEPRRKLKRVDLVEISPVTFPANDKARVGDVKRTLTERDAEKALRDAGFSRLDSKSILAGGFASISLRDAEEKSEKDAILKIINSMRT